MPPSDLINSANIKILQETIDGYEVNNHDPRMDEHRRPLENTAIFNEHAAAASTEWGEGVNTTAVDISVECPGRHHNSHDYQVTWQDNIDPDNMSYEVGMGGSKLLCHRNYLS